MFNRSYPRDPFYLEIGPGSDASPDFFSVDYVFDRNIDRVWDITSKSFDIPRGVVLGVYTEHCLEHIPVEACLSVLKKCHAGLNPGGWIRISMPDLAIYAEALVRHQTDPSASAPYQTERYNLCTPAVALNDVMRLHGHKFVYDYPTMRALLELAGFRLIRKCEFRQGADPKLLRDNEHRAAESLYVEAQK